MLYKLLAEQNGVMQVAIRHRAFLYAYSLPSPRCGDLHVGLRSLNCPGRLRLQLHTTRLSRKLFTGRGLGD